MCFGQFEFLRQLSANPSNVVIGLVRNVESTKTKVDAEIGRQNVHLLRFDLDDANSIPVSNARLIFTGATLTEGN